MTRWAFHPDPGGGWHTRRVGVAGFIPAAAPGRCPCGERATGRPPAWCDGCRQAVEAACAAARDRRAT